MCYGRCGLHDVRCPKQNQFCDAIGHEYRANGQNQNPSTKPKRTTSCTQEYRSNLTNPCAYILLIVFVKSLKLVKFPKTGERLMGHQFSRKEKATVPPITDRSNFDVHCFEDHGIFLHIVANNIITNLEDNNRRLAVSNIVVILRLFRYSIFHGRNFNKAL